MLRKAMVQSLQAKGVLGKIKAQLQAAVFTALDTQEQHIRPLNERTPQHLETRSGKLVALLVLEYLECYNLLNSKSVLLSESYGLGQIKACNRTTLAQQLDMPLPPTTGTALLQTLVENFTRCAQQQLQCKQSSSSVVSGRAPILSNPETVTAPSNPILEQKSSASGARPTRAAPLARQAPAAPAPPPPHSRNLSTLSAAPALPGILKAAGAEATQAPSPPAQPHRASTAVVPSASVTQNTDVDLPVVLSNIGGGDRSSSSDSAPELSIYAPQQRSAARTAAGTAAHVSARHHHFGLAKDIEGDDAPFQVSGVVPFPPRGFRSLTQFDQDQDDDFLTPTLMLELDVQASTERVEETALSLRDYDYIEYVELGIEVYKTKNQINASEFDIVESA